MKKRDFLKIAASVIATPIVASALDDPNIKIVQTDKREQPKIAIDMRTIDLPETGMAMADVLLIYHETGVLIYNGSLGNAPIALDLATKENVKPTELIKSSPNIVFDITSSTKQGYKP